jgi:hypothetical protein
MKKQCNGLKASFEAGEIKMQRLPTQVEYQHLQLYIYNSTRRTGLQRRSASGKAAATVHSNQDADSGLDCSTPVDAVLAAGLAMKSGWPKVPGKSKLPLPSKKTPTRGSASADDAMAAA